MRVNAQVFVDGAAKVGDCPLSWRGETVKMRSKQNGLLGQLLLATVLMAVIIVGGAVRLMLKLINHVSTNGSDSNPGHSVRPLRPLTTRGLYSRIAA